MPYDFLITYPSNKCRIEERFIGRPKFAQIIFFGVLIC